MCLRTGTQRRTKALVEESFRKAFALSGGERRPWLVDARALPGVDPEAWVSISERIAPAATALGILVSDATPAEMARWRALFDSLLLPCRTFVDEAPAVAWLKSIKG